MGVKFIEFFLFIMHESNPETKKIAKIVAGGGCNFNLYGSAFLLTWLQTKSLLNSNLME